MRAAEMKKRPDFPLVRQTDVQNIYHMQMPRWLFSDSCYTDMSLDAIYLSDGKYLAIVTCKKNQQVKFFGSQKDFSSIQINLSLGWANRQLTEVQFITIGDVAF